VPLLKGVRALTSSLTNRPIQAATLGVAPRSGDSLTTNGRSRLINYSRLSKGPWPIRRARAASLQHIITGDLGQAFCCFFLEYDETLIGIELKGWPREVETQLGASWKLALHGRRTGQLLFNSNLSV